MSQLELKQSIDALGDELKKIAETQRGAVDLDGYVKRLLGTKNRVTVLTNVLQTAQERLVRIQQSVEKETVRRQALLESAIDDGVAPNGLV